MSKERKIEREENDPAFWMVTFSDLSMLLLAFFVMRFSMLTLTDEALRRSIKMDAVYKSVRTNDSKSSLKSAGPENGNSSPEEKLVVPEPAQLPGDPSVLKVAGAFASDGNGELTLNARTAVMAVSKIAKEEKRRVVVRVFGPATARNTEKYPSHWEQSNSLALGVVRQMIDAGVPEGAVSAFATARSDIKTENSDERKVNALELQVLRSLPVGDAIGMGVD